MCTYIHIYRHIYTHVRAHTHTHAHTYTRAHTHTVTPKCTYINLYLSIVTMFHVDYSVTTTLLHEQVGCLGSTKSRRIHPSITTKNQTVYQLNIVNDGISRPNVLLVYGWGSI